MLQLFHQLNLIFDTNPPSPAEIPGGSVNIHVLADHSAPVWLLMDPLSPSQPPRGEGGGEGGEGGGGESIFDPRLLASECLQEVRDTSLPPHQGENKTCQCFCMSS